MRVSLPGVVLATIVIGLAACSDASMPTKPGVSAPSTLRADRSSHDHTKTVRIMDECDPATFDAAIGRPGSCVRNGGMKFDQFVSVLTHLQTVPAWKFAPDNVNIRVGDILSATNAGGEGHTFTEVEEFGGGVVDFLNALSGTPKKAPECVALALSDLVAPGATKSEVTDEAGDEKYQCCIHPWMRAVVHIAEK
jgi:plastocyanin